MKIFHPSGNIGLILIAIAILSFACKKEIDDSQACQLQNGELFQPKIIKTERSLKTPSNIPNETYTLYEYSDNLLVAAHTYDKKDSTWWTSTHFQHENGVYIGRFALISPDSTPRSIESVDIVCGYIAASEGSSSKLQYYRNHCAFKRVEHFDKTIGKISEIRNYEVSNGNITKELIYGLDAENRLDTTISYQWINFEYDLTRPNQAKAPLFSPHNYNSNLLIAEEHCSLWSDGYISKVLVTRDYTFDDQGRYTKITTRVRGSIQREEWFFYE
ncbi:MAG: hypothetical protein JJU02_15480 [Cryomorphaceae bacterium]|nr:hypothetical protein [Cryomorphaceae bacterium]